MCSKLGSFQMPNYTRKEITWNSISAMLCNFQIKYKWSNSSQAKVYLVASKVWILNDH
jgi:hypothetical protein